jgi:hypothetical protein
MLRNKRYWHTTHFFWMLFLLQSFGNTYAQSYGGYAGAPYAGVYSILTNPADILNHRVKGDINLVGVSAALGNNIVGFKYSKRNNDYSGTSFKNPIKRNGKFFINADVFGPSFLIRLSDKHAVAVTTRVRAMGNLNGADAALLNTLLPDTISSNFINRNIKFKDVTLAAHAWNEAAFTYTHEVAHNTYGVWKAGLSAKYIAGLGAFSFASNNLGYKLDTFYDPGAGRRKGIVSNLNGRLGLGYTKNLESISIQDLSAFANTTIGFDVGITYEHRGEMQTYETKYNEITNNYVWKIGAAITDIGFVRYQKSQTKWLTKSFNNQNYLLDDLAAPADSSSLAQRYNYYRNFFGISTQPFLLTMQLPTTLRLSYDRYFNKWLGAYAQVSLPVILSRLGDYRGTYNPLSISITGRAETPWGAFYLPLSYNTVGGMQLGASLRLGPLVIGSASLITSRFFKTRGADAYFILRVPLFGYKEYVNAVFKAYTPKATKRQLRALSCPSN